MTAPEPPQGQDPTSGWAPPAGPPAPWAPPPAGAADAPAPWAPPPAGAVDAPPPPREPWLARAELRVAGLLVVALAVVGVLAGLGWWRWSPPRGIALALGAHTLLPDETEAFVAADGRFAVITLAIGLLAGFGVFFGGRRVRGPVVAAGLGIGCLVGAVLTSLVGRLFGGGVSGAGSQKIVTPHLEVRMDGLLLLQAVVALLVYGLLVTMSARDDLGVAAA